MQQTKRRIAAVLAVVMMLGIAGCGAGGSNSASKSDSAMTSQLQEIPGLRPTHPTAEDLAPIEEALPAPAEEETPTPAPADDTDRESLEQIAQLVSGGEAEANYADLSNEELTDLIADQIQQSQNQTEAPESGDPATDPEAQEGAYDENGAMTMPFDQIYPELVENEQVEYDDETLLLKLRDDTISDGMAAAGVAALEIVVPLENAAWYEAKLVLGTDVSAAVEALRALDEVLLVDYNYQVRTTAMAEPEEIPEYLLDNTRAAEQWYLNHCSIPSGMGELTTPGGSSSVIVAVIDTGVDYDHEDLAQNIWVNQGETPDDHIDNDGNGYVDDYYGVNIVAGSGNGDDDNGHGTHVAGIIAAQNNNLGTVGIAYNVQIMPIKAAMASGYLNQSDIARAITYAFENGAEVINMSFGGTACSIAVQDALAQAYSRCVLVASAGNEGAPNQGLDAIPNYPAALSYVLGVMSVDQTGKESVFTNYDVAPFNGVEYELYAPGEAMLSTIPGDRYASWSGTSMAAPVVSAMAALLRSEYTDRDTYPTKFIYGQLTATSSAWADCLGVPIHDPHNLPRVVNLYSALTQMPRPNVGLSDYALFDTEGLEHDTGVNNGDGVIDAGETIALGLTLRNRWGKADNTTVTIDTLSQADIPDPYITIHNDTVDYGSVGTYSDTDAGRIYTDELLTGWEKPFYITVAADCPNDYIFRLNVTITCENGLDAEDAATYTTTGTVELTVRSGTILPSIISEDMELTSDSLYIIPSTTIIQEGVTVTVGPGTHIQFWSDDPNDPYADNYIAELVVEGKFLVEGTAEDPVYLYPADLMDHFPVKIGERNDGYISLRYADITNPLANYNSAQHEIFESTEGLISYAERCTFRMNYDEVSYRYLRDGKVGTDFAQAGQLWSFIEAKDCVFYKVAMPYYLNLMGSFTRCVFADCGISFTYSFQGNDCLFLGNCYIDRTEAEAAFDTSTLVLKEHTPIELNLTDMWYREETDTTYVYDGSLCSNSQERITFDTVHEYLRQLGAEESVIDDEAEMEWYLSGMETALECYERAYPDTYVDYTPDVGDVYERILELPGSDWTLEGLTQAVQELHEPQNSNANFVGNVILNRISTDFDVTHWLRVEAPSASEYTEVPLGGNFWGTTNDRAIGLQILDYTDFPSVYAMLNYKPVLETAPENTFPFVTDVTILNKDGEEVTTVANEEITIRVSFNRDMDTSIPLTVQYGSSYPYTEYTVEGEYVDARTWEGTKLLTTVIENGLQYFVISNGCSAEEDLMLCTDESRFFFELDTTAAQALIMQGNATDTGIELTWTQDDFDTLMGYNVYRSTAEDGYYQRINETIIPAETKEFFDDTVEPGQIYYYNFTVVQTDLTESTPSGKISIQAKDTMAPNIYHTPVYNANTGANLVVSATVTDNLQVTSVKLYYRTTGASSWNTAVMNALNNKYSAIIPADQVTTAGIEYYIEASDGISRTYRGSAANPYKITVTEAVDAGSMGDVNGDGRISNLDALMLLQAANDLLNLDADQFARADLDGNGILTASEALRILQYVSGAVGSIVP